MNDVAELKRYGEAHARAQRIPVRQYARICAGVDSDGEGAGSWVGEWSAAGDAAATGGELLRASAFYNLARFPYPDGAARWAAQSRCVAACAGWAAGVPGVRRIEVPARGGSVACWTTGLSATAPRPLLLVTGGIVSVKEQWVSLLGLAARLGMAAVVTEMPGVGENRLPYTQDSWRMLSDILDGVAAEADVASTYALAPSFSGHAALRCASRDPRLRAVLTVAAPVNGFFTDEAWQPRLPRVTTDTLAFLTGGEQGGLDPADACARLRGWELTAAELAAVGIPVRYVASDEDEIIPPEEASFLREHARDVEVLSYADRHAGPRHAAETRLWLVLSLLRARGQRSLARTMVGVGWYGLRTRRRLGEGLAPPGRRAAPSPAGAEPVARVPAD